jgi:hypothetical protein
VRIRHEVAQLRGKEALHLVHADAAPGENAREHVRHPVRLGDRRRDRRAGIIAAIEPGPAKGRAADAEDGAAFRKGEG